MSSPPAEFYRVDQLINSDKYLPRWGWHDDHKDWDQTSEYLPALMQVKAEYAEFVEVLVQHGMIGGRCLQLGMGECTASHDAFRQLFGIAATISLGVSAWNEFPYPSSDTHSQDSLQMALGPDFVAYDLLFIDAGHTYEDVKQDYEMYSPLVRKGGIIAFHDALKRPGFEEVEVWRFLETLPNVKMIGTEVGIGWMVKE